MHGNCCNASWRGIRFNTLLSQPLLAGFRVLSVPEVKQRHHHGCSNQHAPRSVQKSKEHTGLSKQTNQNSRKKNHKNKHHTYKEHLKGEKLHYLVYIYRIVLGHQGLTPLSVSYDLTELKNSAEHNPTSSTSVQIHPSCERSHTQGSRLLLNGGILPQKLKIGRGHRLTHVCPVNLHVHFYCCCYDWIFFCCWQTCPPHFSPIISNICKSICSVRRYIFDWRP